MGKLGQVSAIMDSTELATIDPKVVQELKVVTEAISVSLAVREITVDFAKRRDELIASASEFLSPPTSDDEQQEILTAQRALQGLRKEVEKQAAALKAPLNAARKNIIEIEDRASESIQKEERRLQGLVNHFQQKLLTDRRAEEQRIETERSRIADQQAQAQREQDEAERLRQKALIAPPAQAAKLEAAAEQLEAEAYGKFLDAESATIPAGAPSAPAPQAREVHDFELIGRNDSEKKESFRRLQAAHPEFFNLVAREETPREFSLKLRIADLVDALNGKPPFQKLTGAPGITITTKLTTLR